MQDYLEAFFSAVIKGRTDYENLMPATIGISRVKQKSLKINQAIYRITQSKVLKSIFKRWYAKIGRLLTCLGIMLFFDES